MKVRLIVYLNKEHIESKNDTELRFTTELKRIPNIGEYFEYASEDNCHYYGEIIKVETFKDDCENEEEIYITINEFD